MDRDRLEALLDRMADGDEGARETLLDYIMKQPEGIRVLAFEALRDGGDDTYEQLMLTLADDPSLLAQPSHPVAERLHPIAQMAAEEWATTSERRDAPPAALLAQLQGGDRSARISAARALADYGAPESIRALVEALSGADLRVAAAAIESLQRIGRAAVPSLLPLLDNADSQVRWHAVKALSTMGDERAVAPLVARLEDRHAGTRWLAAEALAHVGPAAIIPLLRPLAERKSSAWLRQGAAHVLGKMTMHDENAAARYRMLAKDLRGASDAIIPDLVRRELRLLGQDA